MRQMQISGHDLAAEIARHPGDPALRYAFAEAARGEGDFPAAEEALRHTVRLNPRHDGAWMRLAELLSQKGDRSGAADAARHAEEIHASAAELGQAMAASRSAHPRDAEMLLRRLHARFPAEVTTLRLLADICEHTRRADEAEALVAEALRLWPDCDGTLQHQANLFYRHNKVREALPPLRKLLARDGKNPAYRQLHALSEMQLGHAEASADICRTLLKEDPAQPLLWRTLGHALKGAGDFSGAAEAYHRAWALKPAFASACWALANIKTYRFPEDEIVRMRQLSTLRLPRTEACALHFALGKALSDDEKWPEAFQHYAEGNALRRRGTRYSREENHRLCEELAALPVPEKSAPSPHGPTPVFIVGMPRAGSTLLEQMLASHTQIEGTMELPDMPMLAHRLCGPDTPLAGHYADAIREISPEALENLGAEYLARTEIQRTDEKPFFLDKRPDNFFHIPLIVRALPGAKIIDIRRHPMACGLSCYTQLFGGGHGFSYDLADTGHYITDYARLTDKLARELPGQVLQMRYEDIVANPEREIRRALTFLGLSFEEGCLSFYQNKRIVRTASAAQVRRPVYKSGLDYWQHFAPWLGALKDALGPDLLAGG